MSQRAGLNTYEASLARVMAQFGSSDDLLEGISAKLAKQLEGASKEGGEALETWQSQDQAWSRPAAALEHISVADQRAQLSRLRPTWQRALLVRLGSQAQSARSHVIVKLGTQELANRRRFFREELLQDLTMTQFDAGTLSKLPREKLDLFFFRFGAYQAVEALRGLNRRELALSLHRLGEPVSGWMLRDFKASRELKEVERRRIYEVVAACQKQAPQGHLWIKHVGLYFCVVAAGSSNDARLEMLMGRLRPEDRAKLASFARMHQRKSKQALEEAVWESTNHFLSRWSLTQGEARDVS